jgi:hypothetical protein
MAEAEMPDDDEGRMIEIVSRRKLPLHNRIRESGGKVERDSIDAPVFSIEPP